MIATVVAAIAAAASPSSDIQQDALCAAVLMKMAQRASADSTARSAEYGVFLFFIGRLTVLDPSKDWQMETLRAAEKYDASDEALGSPALQCAVRKMKLTNVDKP